MRLEVISGGGAIDDAKYVTITKGHKGALKFSTSSWKLPAEYVVVDVKWQERETSSTGKAIGGAALGGILAGPAGIVAGALIGGKSKDKSTAVITVDVDSGTAEILVRCNAKEFQQLIKLLK